MLIKNINYRTLNKWMIPGILFILLLSWFLSFSKTWTAYMENKALKHKLHDNYALINNPYLIDQKYIQLDSLVKSLSTDGSLFRGSFLQDVSGAIVGIPVQITYDAASSKGIEELDHILIGDIILEGGYKDLVRAIEQLEKVYFVIRILYKDGKCTVRLGKIALQ